MMWRRGRNGANPGMVPPQNRGSSGRGSRGVLSGSSGGSRSRHDGNNGGRSSDDIMRDRLGASSRGRRRLPHSWPEVMPSVRLHHGRVGEGEEMERMGGIKVS